MGNRGPPDRMALIDSPPWFPRSPHLSYGMHSEFGIVKAPMGTVEAPCYLRHLRNSSITDTCRNRRRIALAGLGSHPLKAILCARHRMSYIPSSLATCST